MKDTRPLEAGLGKRSIRKIGFVYKPEGRFDWWQSHCMAPAPVLINEDVIRVFMGCWDKNKISRIGFIDVLKENPTKIVNIAENPVLDIGRDGCFDENGVFPGHVYLRQDGKVFLYYTGFQLGHKIRHYNFGGLAISEDNGASFKRYSEAPIMDRADEGLFVRAGQSIEEADNGFHMVYSAGSSWHLCEGELRPVYDVFYQFSPDGISTSKNGIKIIEADLNVEHGLGRPQIIKLGRYFYCFYTRRIIKDMKYFIGVSRSLDCKTWERIDDIFEHLNEEDTKIKGFDDEMIYFSACVKASENKALIFYSGNYFGLGGLGVIEFAYDN